MDAITVLRAQIDIAAKALDVARETLGLLAPRLDQERTKLPVAEPELTDLDFLQALDHFGGNKRRAADALGVSMKTLYERLASPEWQKATERTPT